MSKYLVLDLETYGKTTYKRFCNPLDPDHFVIANAYKRQGDEVKVDYDVTGLETNCLFDNIDLDSVKVMVGQNFKFDMLWFWSNEKFQGWLKNGGVVWDTALAEYLLQGQQGAMEGQALNLDALAIKYGGTLKDKEVKGFFVDGHTVLDIPEEQLKEYAKEDVTNTELVFLGQLRAAKKKGMLNIIKIYNEHLLALTEMEFNGMNVDIKKARSYADKISERLELIYAKLVSILMENELWPQEDVEFNLNSTKHLSCIFFGDNIKIVKRDPLLDEEGNVVVFKSGAKIGTPRVKLREYEAFVPGLNLEFKEEWRTDAGAKGTSVDVLTDILCESDNEIAKEIINLLLKYRKYKKILGTYLYTPDGKGMVNLVHPDGKVHSEYNTFKTKTGRLSSDNPNLQNVPPFVTKIFNSRFANGSIMELDFSQLEVAIQAYITQSSDMIQDIKDGVDFHCLRLGYAEDRPYEEVKQLCSEDKEWKDKRKKAKVISFQRAYGAHPKTIAADTELPVEVIETVFQKEDKRYPEVNQFYKTMLENIEDTCTEIKKPLMIKVNGELKASAEKKTKMGQYQSVTGKLYTFFNKAAMTSHGLFQYWPMPNIQNYPIQGTAADIVSMKVGEVFRFMLNNRDKGLLINEVHDSVILDIKEEYSEEIGKKIQSIMEDVDTSFKQKLGLSFNVPIKVDWNYGKTWYDAK